ncbi:hypothetical protein K469DRAFT_693429 [Zopfia rhizophila CBS 207.26]|uniref:Uncharacterized protein n=1 Tax=Zopfia rhizophila CBS 207.26 TaxID=1314779 RepID=A0A6A6DL75_9PEZI|nr:hypothetical protein K469DRAFT_693429 [Zopfia rhizophila CBS 207.26]
MTGHSSPSEDFVLKARYFIRESSQAQNTKRPRLPPHFWGGFPASVRPVFDSLVLGAARSNSVLLVLQSLHSQGTQTKARTVACSPYRLGLPDVANQQELRDVLARHERSVPSRLRADTKRWRPQLSARVQGQTQDRIGELDCTNTNPADTTQNTLVGAYLLVDADLSLPCGHDSNNGGDMAAVTAQGGDTIAAASGHLEELVGGGAGEEGNAGDETECMFLSMCAVGALYCFERAEAQKIHDWSKDVFRAHNQLELRSSTATYSRDTGRQQQWLQAEDLKRLVSSAMRKHDTQFSKRTALVWAEVLTSSTRVWGVPATLGRYLAESTQRC